MKGVWPNRLMHNPNLHEEMSIEGIWDYIDGYSFEELYQDESRWNGLLIHIPFPPLWHKGTFVKGILCTNGTSLLLKKFPQIKKLFKVCANSMFGSYPWAPEADIFMTCYKNEAREQYYKNKHPECAHIPCVPLQDADFLNEYVMVPQYFTPKTIDIFTVSTAFPVKNIPIIAKALKVYEEKYNKILKVVYAIGNRSAVKREDGSLDYSNCIDYAKNVLKEVDSILGDTKKYIQFEPYIEYKDLPKYYSAAKCCVLGSLIEGKNRFISEARSCNTPIIVFKDFNKYLRGDFPVFFGNSGEYVPEFTPESLADTIHHVITHQLDYEPRINYLKYNGRKNFLNILIKSLPYFKEVIPDFDGERNILDNAWADNACYELYGVNLYNFLYDKKVELSHVVGMENIEKMLNKYFKMFKIEV